jgi:Skp family chaperone for outer membrane proteins
MNRYKPTLMAAACCALVLALACKSGAPKVVVVDMERVLKESKTAQAAVAEVEGLSQTAQDQLSKLARDIQAAEANHSRSPSELNELKGQWMDLRQRAQDALGAKQEQAIAAVEAETRKAAEALAKEEGWDIVLRKEGDTVWCAPELDKTAAVVARMDAGRAEPSKKP